MPLQQTTGNVTTDAYGGGVAAVPNYIEDVFNTYVWTGTGSNQTLTTNVDTSTYGGLFWTKNRTNAYDHALWATNFSLSGNYLLKSNTTGALTYGTYNTGDYVSNSTTGVTVYGNTSQNYVTWTFRKQPKFFDVVTWTGNGVDGRDISHSLGSSPGFVVIKCTSSSTYWVAKHKDALSLTLNTTNAQGGSANTTNGYVSSVSSTSFNVVAGLTDLAAVNASGQTYVAYLFAHNAGGFGLTGTDNVISCGSFSGNTTVDLGYEPQWVLLKNATSADNWYLIDNMRGWPVQGNGSANTLYANSSVAEQTGDTKGTPTATGFTTYGFGGSTGIYIAIRRGPMKVPTSGTSVFSPVTYTGNATDGRAITTGFVPDTVWWKSRSNATNWRDATLLIGTNTTLSQNLTAAEENVPGYYIKSYQNTGFTYDAWDSSYNQSGYTYIVDAFQRAPSFHDVVCYTGDGTNGKAYNHNLTVVPTLVIVKSRSNTANWKVLYQPDMRVLTLNTTAAYESAANTKYYFGNDTIDISPTATQFTVSNGGSLNVSGATYVAYLFATCAGVSKVGSYTGNGTTQTINCGFTGGARFVLIKRTDSTGDWYVYDTARGMTTLTDPYLLLNSTAAESATLGSVTTVSTGFAVNASILAAINTNGASYIFLAIA